ncbi:MAG: AAA family ATPase [Deltaproteobacteria bacterium]|nr:AAA family ATPase [Deltaproteobacteria bacterium]
MKILKLEIKNVRGIKELSLSPEGENIVVYGPNGSGKSAIIDALDFLLTGKITRLTGAGSGAINFKEHGPHIDHEPKDAIVKATIQVNGTNDPFKIERRMSQPKKLICPDDKLEILNNIQDVASKGQHILSRAELLKFIAAEAGTRSEEIQALLNLNEVENLRKTFQKATKEAKKNVSNNESNYLKSAEIISTTLPLTTFSEDGALNEINTLRSTLKGDKIEILHPEKLQEGINPVSIHPKIRVDFEILQENIKAIKSIINEDTTSVFENEKELRKAVNTLKSDTKLKRNLSGSDLINKGIALIDESGACPLCLTDWEAGQLKTLLEKRLSEVNKATSFKNKIDSLKTNIIAEIMKLQRCIGSFITASKELKENDVVVFLEVWDKNIDYILNTLKNASEYTSDPKSSFKTLLVPDKIDENLEKILTNKKDYKELTPEQKAWDTLTAVKPALERYIEDKTKLEASKIVSSQASIIEEVYNTTKDAALDKLYESVSEDFISYYKLIHGDDEKDFNAVLKPTGPSLSLEVDFHKRGLHHPRALHSEGHQDSMGLCLYLALNNKLSSGKINLILLDDVVMSIDNAHRRSICGLLNEHFSDRQFIITTHNTTWARQLKTENIVTKSNLIEFKKWTVKTGPHYGKEEDVWEKIENDLEEGNVPSAAHKLRLHLEYYFENACGKLRGKIPYREDHLWDFGDYLIGSKQAYLKYLKSARKSANSWEDSGKVEKIDELKTVADESIAQSQVEQWGINANVHHSKWDDFSKEDFLPIAEAFKDLEGIFKCSGCQGLLSVSFKEYLPQNITCSCGEVFWNLVEK